MNGDLVGLVLSLNECWNVRMQLEQRYREALDRIKQLEDELKNQHANAKPSMEAVV